MRKNEWWGFGKPALILAAIATVCGLALAGVHMLTKGAIERRAVETENAARQQVIAADAFAAKTMAFDGKTVAYYEAPAADGSLVGYVFTATVTGKAGGLVVMTGISADGTVTGVAVTENDESAGYVGKVEKGGLFAAFKGEAADKFTLNQDVDAISGATKTSKGVVDGVNRAVAYYRQLKGGAADE